MRGFRGKSLSLLGGEGMAQGESTRLSPVWPGFDSPTRRHMWVEFVVGSRPCSEGFFSLLKNQHFQIPIRSGIRDWAAGLSVEKLFSVTLVKQSQLFNLQLLSMYFMDKFARLHLIFDKFMQCGN